jgi:hypothetical protein
MKKPAILSTAALALCGVFLTACGDFVSNDVPKQVLDNLLDKPDGSYTLVPRNIGTLKKPVFDNSYTLVIKKYSNLAENVVNSDGTKGSKLCAGFESVTVSPDSDGQLHPWYIGMGRGAMAFNGPGLKTMKPEDLLAIPTSAKSGYQTGDLIRESLMDCRFTPQP